jgi:medium-chain acyl-[acyl-carrier-protein] hydrolase
MSTSAASTWLKKPDTLARYRLFCFPYAGGGASAFHTWQSNFTSEIGICPVQLPGRENRIAEEPFSDLSLLVQAIADVLLPHLETPFAFFGHSMGTLISFELARQLRRQNAPTPVHLFVAGHRAPQLPDPDPPTYHLPEAEFVDSLRRFNGTPDTILQNAELMQVMMPALRADMTISETYRYTPEEPLDCSISAFCGMQDSEASYDAVQAWREQARGSFRMRMLPGDHFFLRSQQTLLLQAISQDIKRSLSSAPVKR